MARRLGRSDPEVKAIREAVGDAFAALIVDDGGEPVELAVSAAGGHLAIRLGRGHEVRDVPVG